MILIIYQLPQIQKLRLKYHKMKMLLGKYVRLITFPKKESTKLWPLHIKLLQSVCDSPDEGREKVVYQIHPLLSTTTGAPLLSYLLSKIK